MNPLSGYIEIEVDGDVLPFKFGSNAWALFCDMHKIELWQISESGVLGRYAEGKMIAPPDIIKMRDLFHCAYVSACRSKGEIPKVNLFKLGDILDEYRDVVYKLQETMIKSKMFGITLEELGKEDGDVNFPSPGQE